MPDVNRTQPVGTSAPIAAKLETTDQLFDLRLRRDRALDLRAIDPYSSSTSLAMVGDRRKACGVTTASAMPDSAAMVTKIGEAGT